MGKVRWLALALVAALALTGPLAAVGSAQQAQPLEYWSPGVPPAEPPGVGYKLGAGIATAVNVPMRLATCVVGSALGFAVLAITLGSGHRAAMAVAEEGCQGPWMVTAERMKGRSWDDFGGR